MGERLKILSLSPFDAVPTVVNRTLPLLKSLGDCEVDLFFPHAVKLLRLSNNIMKEIPTIPMFARRNKFFGVMKGMYTTFIDSSFRKFFYPIAGVDEISVFMNCVKRCSSKENDYDLIHVSKPWLRSAGAALWLGRKWKVPIILDMDDYDISPQNYLLRQFQGVVVASRELNRLFKSYEPLYIPNSTDLSFFDPTKFRVRKNKTCSIIWSGILYHHLKLENLLIALKLMKEDAQLVFSGEGPKKEMLISLARSLEIEHKVSFEKWTGRDVVPERLANAYIGIIYTAETLYEKCKCPGKLFEYMAMELPIVATNVGEVAATIQEADCGISVPPNNPQALADALDYLVQNPDLRRKLGENGRQFLARKQNFELLGSRLREYFDQIVCRHG